MVRFADRWGVHAGRLVSGGGFTFEEVFQDGAWHPARRGRRGDRLRLLRPRWIWVSRISSGSSSSGAGWPSLTSEPTLVSSSPLRSRAEDGAPDCSVVDGAGRTSQTASRRSPMPEPCSAETGKTLRKPRVRKFSAPASSCAVSILLTARKRGLPATDEDARKLLVGGGDVGAAVDDHDDGIGFVESDAGLVEDLARDQGFVVGDDAAGVDEADDAAAPFDLAVDAIAGDAGLVADDAAAGAGEAVEEGGFADVGTAADGDERLVVLGGGCAELVAGRGRGTAGERGRRASARLLRGAASSMSPDDDPVLILRAARGDEPGFGSCGLFGGDLLALLGRNGASDGGAFACTFRGGPLPSLGRVLAWRCFLPIRFFSSRFGAIKTSVTLYYRCTLRKMLVSPPVLLEY